jgi:ribosomal protein S18 acetylase RimI-like enzyme
MIKQLDNKDKDIAKKIRSVFQVSYPIEAKLLNAINFPPLNRTIDDFINSDTQFYSYWKDEALAAVMEISTNHNSTLIQSLVVDPKYFRQGIAGKLINFVFENYKTKVFNVETGLANLPAIKLYKRYGFKEIKQYDTEIGIRKIRFEKIV